MADGSAPRARRWALLIAAIAIAAIAVWWWRSRASETVAASTDRPTAARGSEPTTPAAPVAEPAPLAPIAHLQRVDAATRARLIAQINAARMRREHLATPPATGSAGPAPSLGEVRELTPDDMLAAVMPAIPLLQECYAEARGRLPPAGGVVQVAMTIAGEPDVAAIITDSALTSDDGMLVDDEFTRCMHETLLSVALPAPPAGGSQSFSISVELRPDEPADAAP